MNEYGDIKKVRIEIFGTTFIKPEIALVRYAQLIEERGSTKILKTHFTATISFKYVGKTKMSEKDRSINPLGFQVVEYRNDPDSNQQEIISPTNDNEKGLKQ